MKGLADTITDPPRAGFMEHRWGQRIRCRARVRISAGAGMTGFGVVRDVSMSGAFIETAMGLPPYAPVEIAVSHRDDPGETELAGCVVRVNRDGFAVEWTDAYPGAICPLLGCLRPCSDVRADADAA